MIWVYIALTRTPSIDCYWVGVVPKVWDLGCVAAGAHSEYGHCVAVPGP